MLVIRQLPCGLPKNESWFVIDSSTRIQHLGPVKEEVCNQFVSTLIKDKRKHDRRNSRRRK